jgi:hypothetical protein
MLEFDRRALDLELRGAVPVGQPTGRAIISAEFCTVPRLRIRLLSCVIIRPSSMLSRSTSDSVKATEPTEIAPESHRLTENPAIAAIIKPESAANEARTPVRCRVKGRIAAMNWSKPWRM